MIDSSVLKRQIALKMLGLTALSGEREWYIETHKVYSKVMQLELNVPIDNSIHEVNKVIAKKWSEVRDLDGGNLLKILMLSPFLMNNIEA
jgi:hypothetical protein